MSSKAKRSSGGPSFSPHSKNGIFENLVVCTNTFEYFVRLTIGVLVDEF